MDWGFFILIDFPPCAHIMPVFSGDDGDSGTCTLRFAVIRMR